MTAITTTSTFSASSFADNARPKSRRKYFLYQAEVTDFDGDTHTFELEAPSEAEAEAAAVERSADMGLQADYIMVYKYEY